MECVRSLIAANANPNAKTVREIQREGERGGYLKEWAKRNLFRSQSVFDRRVADSFLFRKM